LQLQGSMDLRCKVFRGSEAGQLEADINRFLSTEVNLEGELQLEEITQSESAGGVTITLWYSLLFEAEVADELDVPQLVPKTLEVS
jgi:hypothetical protein